jgi:exonuclease VII large subunit
VQSVKDIQIPDTISVMLRDGSIKCQVQEVKDGRM